MKLFKQPNFFTIIKDTFVDWNNSPASRDSASIAYYAIFSIPGLLIIVIWVCANVFGLDAIRGQLSSMIGGIMGPDAATSIQTLIAGAVVDKTNIIMKVIGIGTLVFGSTTLFFNIQKALNNIWEVEAAPKKAWLKFLLDRANSLGLIIIIAFLLLITSLLSGFIGLANDWITRYFGIETYAAVQVVNFLLSFGIIVLLFAIMFKFLPDVEIKWKSVWVGAIVTTLLFNIGKLLLSFYFGTFKPTSIFGAAGSIVLVMMWINYSCQLILFGADFTKNYAYSKGHIIKPSKFAKWSSAKILREQEVKTDETAS